MSDSLSEPITFARPRSVAAVYWDCGCSVRRGHLSALRVKVCEETPWWLRSDMLPCLCEKMCSASADSYEAALRM